MTLTRAMRRQKSGRLRKLVASGFPVYFAGNLLSAGIGLGLLLVLVRKLGPDGFGRVASLVNFLDIGFFLVDMALFSGVVHLASKYAESDPERSKEVLRVAFYARVTLATIFAFGGILFAPVLAQYLFGSVEYVATLRIVFGAVVAGAIYSQAISTLLSRKQFGRLAATVLLKNGMRALVVAGLLATGAATMGSVAVGYGVAAVLAAGASLMLCRFDFLSVRGNNGEIARELFDINKWAIVAAVGMLGVRIDVIMLERISGSTDVGFYAAAAQLVIVVSLFSQSLANYIFPSVAALKDLVAMRMHVERVRRLVPFAFLPLVFIVPLAWWGIPFVLGEGYADARGTFVVLMISAAVTLALNPLILLFFPLERVDVLAKAAIGMVALRIGLNILLIPSFGAFGAAMSDLTTKLIVNGATLAFLYRLLWPSGAGTIGGKVRR